MNVEPIGVAQRPLPFGGAAVKLQFENPAEQRRDPPGELRWDGR